MIADLLPNNYMAVDLGSSDGKDTKDFAACCKSKGKEGVFLNVDPFITKEGIIKKTSEEFMAECKDK